MADDQFKFLSTGEFERLTLKEKLSYVQRAYEVINKLRSDLPKPPGEEHGK